MEETNAQLDLLSRRDTLTGLSNRCDFEQFIALTWNREQINNNMVSVLVICIDYFHQFKENFGSTAADKCLIAVAGITQTHFAGASHIFARKDSDNFVALAYGQKHSHILQTAEGMRTAVELQ